MATKLTPWFPLDVKPVRAGVYERRKHKGFTWYARFNGQHWMIGSFNFERATNINVVSKLKAEWRGVRK